MDEKENVKPLAKLIDRFIFIGQSRYSGKLFDNVLNILDNMELEEQKNLIRGLINLYLFSASKEVFTQELIDMAKAPDRFTLIEVAPPAPVPAPPITEAPKKDAANDEISKDDYVPYDKKQLTFVLCLVGSITIAILGAVMVFILSGDGPSSVAPLETVMKYSAVLMPFFK